MFDGNDSNALRRLMEGVQRSQGRYLSGMFNGINPKLLHVQEEAGQLRCRLDALQRWLCWLAFVAFVCICIIVIVVAVQYVRLFQRSQEPQTEAQLLQMLKEEKLCFSCNRIRLSSSPEEDETLKFFRHPENRDQCCVETPLQLLDLLNLHIDQRYRDRRAKMHKNGGDSAQASPFVAAHLMGSVQQGFIHHAPGILLPVGHWTHDDDLAFMHHIAYRHGRIVVPVDGLYFVYSHLSYLEIFDVLKNDPYYKRSTRDSLSLSHYIYRYNILYPVDGEEKLMQNSITINWNPERAFHEDSSYLGAIFFLRKGDEMFVKVSNMSLLAGDPKANCFGLFKISKNEQ